MTESEKLKQNTEIELIKQRSEELNAHMIKLIERAEEARYWQLRGIRLDLFCLVAYIIAILIVAFSGLEATSVDELLQWMFIVVTWSILRTMTFTARVGYAEGQIVGMFDTLRILGMLKVEDDDEGGSRKTKRRKSLFPRFKELFERIGRGEAKEAPAAT